MKIKDLLRLPSGEFLIKGKYGRLPYLLKSIPYEGYSSSFHHKYFFHITEVEGFGYERLNLHIDMDEDGYLRVMGRNGSIDLSVYGEISVFEFTFIKRFDKSTWRQDLKNFELHKKISNK